jgi:fructan beta-fructosidase
MIEDLAMSTLPAFRTGALMALIFPTLAVPAMGQLRQAGPAHRELLVDHRYLHIPVRNGAAKQRMKLSVEGLTIREFEVELAEAKPDFWVFTDLQPYRGKTLRIEVVGGAPARRILNLIMQADSVPDYLGIYREPLRPQFHFTSWRGWLNDPNGLVWQAGFYHLFYQHNPYGWSWGNMHWGHAVSPDLVHWQEWPIALYPREFGDWCFSGSGVVDIQNTGGFQQSNQPTLVVAYTSTGRGECIAYSNDQGRSWKEYDGNPVVRHAGRDPKLVWYEPARRWDMAVYDETGGRQGIAFYSSSDLKHWTQESKIDGFFECPDLFELPVDGHPQRTMWALHAADGKYVLGKFDGKAFQVSSGKEKLQVWYGNFYAAQSYSNAPDHRRVQIGWANGVVFPGMPFNQQLTIPVELSLRSAEDGARMFAQPVAELASLRGRKHEWLDLNLKPGDNPVHDLKGDLFEIQVDFSPAKAEALALDLRGTPILYERLRKEVICRSVRAPLRPKEGRVRLQVFLDRGSIEVFGNDGRVAMSIAAIADQGNRSASPAAADRPTCVRSLSTSCARAGPCPEQRVSRGMLASNGLKQQPLDRFNPPCENSHRADLWPALYMRILSCPFLSRTWSSLSLWRRNGIRCSAWMSIEHLSDSPGFQSRCTAGKATMWAASKTRARSWAADWP